MLTLRDEPPIGKYVKAGAGCRMLTAVFIFVLLAGQGTSPTVTFAVNVPPSHKQTKPTGKELAGLKTPPPHAKNPANSPPSPRTKGQGLKSLPGLLHGPNGQELRDAIHQSDVLTTPVPTP